MRKIKRGKIEADLAELLRDFIIDKGLTIADVSKAVGCSPHTISRWIRGQQSMKLITWEKLNAYIDNYED